ncbi:MAG: hypothetical protein NT169_29165 [Chloroflexi bacterium]|nr:hypothetical protein [Chloroflexota bacterium]
MKRHTHSRWVLLLVLVAILAGQVIAQAQTGGGYDLTWSTIGGGGYMYSTGGSYSLGGTIGQPGAGLLSGDSYTLSGGFWNSLPGHEIYLPLIVRP